ncbi:50S ribosomal protein L11 methyltransferase [Methanobacterium oryzae]|uniref:50S ribosomal protein L11 methyltransferase n=1 Tax=Methanobacterium oryzae TaxID=69540 RepID=UPI003D193B4A
MCALKQPSEDFLSMKAKMRTTPYHFNLLSDTERLSAFLEAIKQKAKGTVYDIGAGCGILSILAVPYSNFIYAVEKDSRSAKLAESNFKEFNNILLINDDARNVIFEDKADLIICEMLDTALIDEEQVPVVNSILKYLKDDGEIIPQGILNGAEAIYVDRDSICYDDEFESSRINYQILSNLVIYSEFNFKNLIEEYVETEFELEICKKGTFSGIKITTFTLLTNYIICGPTPMLNPPLLIPTGKMNVNIGDIIKVKLSYKMGGGLDSIQTRVKKIS